MKRLRVGHSGVEGLRAGTASITVYKQEKGNSLFSQVMVGTKGSEVFQ